MLNREIFKLHKLAGIFWFEMTLALKIKVMQMTPISKLYINSFKSFHHDKCVTS